MKAHAFRAPVGRRILGILAILCLSAAPAAAQPAPANTLPPPATTTGDGFSLDLPTPAELFRPESEATALERLRQAELKKGVKNVQFPPTAPVQPQVDFAYCCKPVQTATYWPAVICFGPLYFEDPRAERFGRRMPVLEPAREVFLFYVDVLRLPNHLITQPPCTTECRHY
jgi:hypothetical protein